ncbi:MAG: transglycosylase SLT domain-containing protein [Defluviimonas sp.]|nr:transglycosylase SLT domain-containing protein [Defluviimonas sp.]
MAVTDPAQICDAAATRAAEREGVPLTVLQAITRSETGRSRGGKLQPWPWTVNMEGAGHWFDSENLARDFAYRSHDRGARSFDVGCFQINYKWHGKAFSSIDEMFDPVANAVYAARFLKELHAETGSWEAAAGAYHSRTKEHADRYAARFQRIRSKLEGRTMPQTEPAPEIVLASAEIPRSPQVVQSRVNRYPLLQAGDGGAIGSLVRFGAPGAGSLFANLQAKPLK